MFSNVRVVFSAAQDARDVFCLDRETCSCGLVIRGGVELSGTLPAPHPSAGLGMIPLGVLQAPLAPALSTTHVHVSQAQFQRQSQFTVLSTHVTSGPRNNITSWSRNNTARYKRRLPSDGIDVASFAEELCRRSNGKKKRGQSLCFHGLVYASRQRM